MTISPEIRLAPKLRRDRARIDTRLLAIFGQLSRGQARWPLFLFGPSGTGKTCASLWLCDQAETAGYATVDRLCDTLIALPKGQALQWWEEIGRKGLYVLDEIGTQQRTHDFHRTVIRRVLDERELGADRRGIYISNRPPAELQKIYDDRIVSRLLAGTIYQLGGGDRRVAHHEREIGR